METTKEQVNVSVLSRRLMDGWTLLKEECPNNCKLALIAKDNKIQCVNCENYYRKDANGMIWYSRLDDDTPSQLPSQTLKELTKTLPLPPSSPDVQIYNISSSKKENGIKPKPPSPPIGRRLDFSSVPSTPLREPFAPKLSSPSIPLSTAGQRITQSSSKVAQKLLEGWTLVGRGCINCNGTLVADKTNRAFCVSCNTYDGIVAPKVLPSSSSSSSPFGNGHHKEKVGLTLDSVKSPQSILEKTIKSLYDKMEAARELLENTNNINDCNKLVTLISECGNSIKVLQSISI